MEVGRLHRVLKIITLLQGRRFYNANELAAECSVSRRTVHRDLNMIEKAGIPFFYDRQSGGYQIHQTGYLPAINFSLDEALAVVLVASELGRAGRMPLVQPARDAAAKIESTLPLGMRAVLGQIVPNMAVRPGPTARHNALQEIYAAAQHAIAHRESVDAVYISFHDQGQIRTRIDPYWLLFSERAWYLIGRSSKHKAVRTFKLGRLKSLAATGQIFKRPAGLTLERHLGNAWRIMRGDTAYEVELRFSPLISPNVAEVNWHPTQRVRWDDDGRGFLSVTVDGLDEIVWWVLGYGPEVEVLRPPELRERVAAKAREMLKLYATA